jgi:hypothetical protein
MTENLDPLLTRIEFALDLYGVSATAFSYAAGGDPALVAKMRKGRVIHKPALRAKIESVLSQIEKDGEL